MPKDFAISEEYLCPISGQIMIDPVTTADGNTYEREKIEEWLKTNDRSPLTNESLPHKELTNNLYARRHISNFLDSYPELYDRNEVYLPKSWVAEFVRSIKGNQFQEVQRWLDKDGRLLTLKLEGDFIAANIAWNLGFYSLVDALLTTLRKKNKIIMPDISDHRPARLNMVLEEALNSGDYIKCELLLKRGAEVEQPETSTQNTLLHRMVIEDNQQAISWLLEKKSLLESRNREGNTPLLLSVVHNNVKLAEFLLKMKANAQVENVKQQNPILIALLNQNKPMLCLLVGHEKANLPPLHLALELNNNEIIKALLNHKIGAIETRDEQQRTPFYNAVERGNPGAAILFLAQGANPLVSCGVLQLNALHIAAQRGDVETLRYLLQTRSVALINAQNVYGDTPLHLAVQTGCDSIIPLLIEAGAYHKIKNEQSQTPIELARTQKKPKLENLILQTVRELKQAKLKKTNWAHQVATEQASEIANLKATLQSQEQSFKKKLSEAQKEQTEKIAQLESALLHESTQTVELKNALENQKQGFESMQQTLLHQFQVSEEKKRVEEKRAAGKERCLRGIPEFLRLVVEGEQEKAESMLKETPKLALASGEVKDLSERTFTDITGFQYAVWALDWHMWRMIKKYLPNEDAKLQAQAFETGAWVRQHDVHANLNNLIHAYQNTLDLYKASKNANGNKAWIQKVGGAQRLLPAHVVNEYCHPSRPFYPLPNFKDDLVLPRSRTVSGGEWFITMYSSGVTGGFAIRRGAAQACGQGGLRDISRRALEGAADLEAIRALNSIRTAQRDELIAELRPKPIKRKAV